MTKTNTIVKRTEIESAYADFKACQKSNNLFGHMMINLDTGKVWTNIFHDENSFIRYDNKNIVDLSAEVIYRNREITMSTVSDTVENYFGFEIR